MKTKLFLLLLLISCVHTGCMQKPELHHLKSPHFRYAAYRWDYGEKETDTGWKLHIHQYVEAYPDGHFRALRSIMGLKQWVEGSMKIGAQKLVSAVLQNIPLGKDLGYGINDGFLYCGLTYRIDYALPDSPFSNIVEFIPHNRPGVLKELIYVLDNIVYGTSQCGQVLNLSAYEQELRADANLPRWRLPDVEFKSPQ